MCPVKHFLTYNCWTPKDWRLVLGGGGGGCFNTRCIGMCIARSKGMRIHKWVVCQGENTHVAHGT